MSLTPLLDRIAARSGKPAIVVPIGNRRPVWLRRVDEKGFTPMDRTSEIYVNGAWQDSTDGGAA